jgi:O-antigen/teichoic acid export membrane protein
VRVSLSNALQHALRDPERRLMLASLIDAGLSSLATFVIGVYAARSLTPVLLGGYALTFAAYSMAAIVPDAAVFTPLEVLVVRHPRSARLGLLPHTLRTGLLAALLPALAVLLSMLLTPAEVPQDVEIAFTVTAIGCVVLSPLQDHLRRMLHSAGQSWLAVIVASLQLLTAVVGVLFFARSDLPLAWAPFGVLGAANLISMSTGLLLVRRSVGSGVTSPAWHWKELARPGSWMLFVGLVPASVTLLASALVARLASPAMLGYAETARVVAQPLIVLSLGLSATFSPKLVAAAQRGDHWEAVQLRREYLRLVIGAAIAYAALASYSWTGNPMSWLVPKAYVIKGLVAVTMLSVLAQSLALPGRFEMLGAGRERALTLAELAGNALRVATSGASAVLGAFAIPLGTIALCVARILSQGRMLKRHYAAEARFPDELQPSSPSVTDGPLRDSLTGEGAKSTAQAPLFDLESREGEVMALHGIECAEDLSPSRATVPAVGASGAHRTPLRVGVLLEQGLQPTWVAHVLSAVRALPFCRVVLVVWIRSPGEQSPTQPSGWLKSLSSARRRSAYTLYSALDSLTFAVQPDPLALVSISEAVADIPVHHVVPPRHLEGAAWDEQDLEAIARANLDVALYLGAQRLTGGALGLAQHGVWWCAHGTRAAHPTLSGVWEVLERRPVSTVELRVQDHQSPDGRIIDRSYLRTQRFSIGRNRARLYRKSITLLTLRLRELFEVGSVPEVVPSDTKHSSQTTPSQEGRSHPENGDTLRAVVGIGASALRRVVQRAQWPGGWFIAYQRQAGITADAPLLIRPREFSALVPPGDRFWADPFPVIQGDRHFIFFEEYLFATGKGHIAVTEVGADGRCSAPVPVLERDYHLSYPFVFSWQGMQYMVPETLAAGRIEVYRSTGFPHQWEFHCTMLDGIRAVDPTLVQWDGRWWMFANAVDDTGAHPGDWNEQLFLFHAPSPFGPWTAHRRNPVKWDVRGSRPAGRLFRINGELYRPAQDCTERYGGAIRIYRVVRLDVDEYRESESRTIMPDWRPNLIGTHTINAVPGLAVIDGRLSYRAARRASAG